MENRPEIPLVGVERRGVWEATGIEWRKHEEGAELPVLTGYAAVFNSLSVDLGWFRETIAPGAFRQSIADGADVKALRNHEPSELLARTRSKTLSVVEDAKGLKVEIHPANTSVGRDTVELVRRGDLDQMSFAFKVIRHEIDESDPDNVIRTLLEVELRDVSVVTDPAYLAASVQLAKRDFESAKRGGMPPVAGSEDRIRSLENEIRMLRDVNRELSRGAMDAWVDKQRQTWYNTA